MISLADALQAQDDSKEPFDPAPFRFVLELMKIPAVISARYCLKTLGLLGFSSILKQIETALGDQRERSPYPRCYDLRFHIRPRVLVIGYRLLVIGYW